MASGVLISQTIFNKILSHVQCIHLCDRYLSSILIIKSGVINFVQIKIAISLQTVRNVNKCFENHYRLIISRYCLGI